MSRSVIRHRQPLPEERRIELALFHPTASWQMRPLSRGYVEARSNWPGDMPTINPRYL
jgi:hypothetical protein